MIASIRGKKPHVYRVIILKQMADHNSALPIHRDTWLVLLFFPLLSLINSVSGFFNDTFFAGMGHKKTVTSFWLPH